MSVRCLSAVLLPAVFLLPDGVTGAEPAGGPIAGFYVRNAEMRLALQAAAKEFCIDLRDFHTGAALTGARADRIRGMLDPHYLAEHDLEEGDLPIVTDPFLGFHDFRVADDLRTVLCIVNTDAGGKEVIVLKLDGVEGEEYTRLYFTPVNPPDPETGFFEPWILKVTLD